LCSKSDGTGHTRLLYIGTGMGIYLFAVLGWTVSLAGCQACDGYGSISVIRDDFVIDDVGRMWILDGYVSNGLPWDGCGLLRRVRVGRSLCNTRACGSLVQKCSRCCSDRRTLTIRPDIVV
jgi:hypothetical protein